MATLKYTVIKSKKQYDNYCKLLDDILESDKSTPDEEQEIELLTVLIEKWDAEHNIFKNLDPIVIIRSLMKDHDLAASDLTTILGISKSYLSEVLSYKKGLSKDVIRKLAVHFKMAQEVFNRPYSLSNVQPTRRRILPVNRNTKQKTQHKSGKRAAVKNGKNQKLQSA